VTIKPHPDFENGMLLHIQVSYCVLKNTHKLYHGSVMNKRYKTAQNLGRDSLDHV
jgi:hypothetical protein